MDIPDDLREFLATSANRKLKLSGCEIGEATLYAPDELVVKTFTVNKGNRKHRFRGVDLVKACNGYSPEGVMVWFPAVKLYGQWDCDHHKIIVYPGVTWTDIAKAPKRYFNGQWEPDDVLHRYLQPRKARPKPNNRSRP